MRIDPAPSLPWATAIIPELTAQPDPPLDPPALKPGCHGLRVGGWMSGSVTGSAPNSEVASLPRITKPPRRSWATVRSSTGDHSRGKLREPKRVRDPRTKFRSFTAVGTPQNGGNASICPRRCARAISRSFAWAARRARPSCTSTKAHSRGLSRAILVSAAPVSSSADSSRRRSSRACSVAGPSSTASTVLIAGMPQRTGDVRLRAWPAVSPNRPAGARPTRDNVRCGRRRAWVDSLRDWEGTDGPTRG
jgi:hypothetical protein